MILSIQFSEVALKGWIPTDNKVHVQHLHPVNWNGFCGLFLNTDYVPLSGGESPPVQLPYKTFHLVAGELFLQLLYTNTPSWKAFLIISLWDHYENFTSVQESPLLPNRNVCTATVWKWKLCTGIYRKFTCIQAIMERSPAIKWRVMYGLSPNMAW